MDKSGLIYFKIKGTESPVKHENLQQKPEGC